MRILVLISLMLSMGVPVAAAGPVRGERLYQQWCDGCHGRITETQPTLPGTTPLAERYGDERRAALVDRKDLTPEAIKFFVRRGVSFMPFFRKTELTDAELDDLAIWLAGVNEGK